MIKLKNVSYYYHDGSNGITDINCKIKKEESAGIIGENGSGKTTLLLALCGFLRHSGKIFITGKEMNKKNAGVLRKKIGMLFQEPDDQLFLPTVYENIEYGIRDLSEKRKHELIHNVLDYINLHGYENRHAYHLSIGEKKRVALASVFVMKPDIYFFDEPSANLDPKSRKNIIKLIKKTQGVKLIASHDLDLIKTLCKRIILLYKGEIKYDHSADYLFKNSSLLKKYNLD